MWAFYPFEKLVFKNVLKILLINIWIFIRLLIYMWGVEGVTVSLGVWGIKGSLPPHGVEHFNENLDYELIRWIWIIN